MVAEVTNAKVKKHMGATNHHHRWQTAIKSEGEIKETKVLDIGWQTGRTGKITPVLRLETIEVDGANISNVTAHHAGNVRDLKLGKGAKRQNHSIRRGHPKTQVRHQNRQSVDT